MKRVNVTLPSEATIVPFQDFTVRFSINTTNGVNPAESKWIQISVNDKYSESFELNKAISKIDSLYVCENLLLFKFFSIQITTVIDNITEDVRLGKIKYHHKQK